VAQSNAYYLLKEKVIDGTVCGHDTYDICVNGICRTAGCDHMLGSNTQLGTLNAINQSTSQIDSLFSVLLTNNIVFFVFLL
jgi:hypothetical protein